MGAGAGTAPVAGRDLAQAQKLRVATAREEKYRRRQGEVIDAAAAVFAEKGYHGASTTDIADRLGIRQGSLYYYFASKEAALEVVCYKGVEGFSQGLEEILKGTRGAAGKLRGAVLNHLRPVRERPDYVRVFLRDRHHLPDCSRRKIGGLSRKYEKQLRDIFREGVDNGEFRADLDCRLAALALLGMLNGVAQWYGRQNVADLERIADEYLTLILAGASSRG